MDSPAPPPAHALPGGSPLVALDIDGTIVHHDGYLSPRVASAITTLADTQATVMIATGRSVLATMPLLDELGLVRDGWYAVCSNGAVTVALDPSLSQGYRLHDVVTFDPGPAVAVLRQVLPDAIIAVEDVGVGFKVNKLFPEPDLAERQTVVTVEELIAEPVPRVTFRDVGGRSPDFAAQIDRIGLHGVNYAVGFSSWLDLSPEGVSKASGLESIRIALGVDIEHTIAVGDQRNDIEMLQWAGRGVAMGQAPPEVVAVANEVTDDVTNDGLALVLEDVATSLRWVA
ncbi:MAG: HAD hydrolase family protein [Ornithinimicrobium sp.]